MERMCTTLTATFVECGAVHGSDGKGQESDKFELHDGCEDWNESTERCDIGLL